MGWTVSTFSGKSNGTAGAWRTAMFELCRAINERENAVAGAATTQFYKANGTLSANIASADLVGMRTTGTYAKQNLTKIQAAIKGLVSSGYFVTGTGKTAAYTVASLESAIGASFLAAPTSINHAAYWQQLKDALDLLIYAKRNVTALPTSSSYRVAPGPAAYTDIQDCWDAALADSPSSWFGYLVYLGAQQRFTPPEDYRSYIVDSVSYEAEITSLEGTITEAWYKYTVTESPANTLTGTMDIDIDGTALNTPSASGEVQAGAGDILFDDTNAFTASFTADTTYPMSASSYTFRDEYRVSIDSIDVYFDLASVLTDQA